MNAWKSRVAQLLAVLGILFSAHAQAEPRDAASRRAAYVQARDAILAKDWAGAQKILAELWAEAPSYDVALGLGQAELNLQEFAHAATHLRYALDNMPPRETDELRARAQEFVELARQHLATVEVWTEPTDAAISVDGEAVDTTTSADVFVEVGPHSISARHANYEPAEVRVDALQGQTYPVRLQLSPLLPVGSSLVSPPAESAPPTPVIARARTNSADRRSSRGTLVPVYVSAGVTAVGLGVGIGTLVAAGNKESDKNDILARLPEKPACGRGTPYVVDCGHVKDLSDQASTLRTLGYASVGVAIAAAGTATYFLLTREHAKVSETAISVQVLPTVAPSTLGALVRGRF